MLESATHVGLQVTDGPLSIDQFGAESARIGRAIADRYHRYHIETEEVDDADPLPHRFLVKVGKVGLAKLIGKESLKYFGQFDVILARPCTYGVFSGPVGGFVPTKVVCWLPQVRSPAPRLREGLTQPGPAQAGGFLHDSRPYRGH